MKLYVLQHFLLASEESAKMSLIRAKTDVNRINKEKIVGFNRL
jgi:hypothetical protein